jgi:predicted amidophosphoribosyltransferase
VTPSSVKPTPREPSVQCPNCAAYVYVNDDWCWRCTTPFREGELRVIYEEEMEAYGCG